MARTPPPRPSDCPDKWLMVFGYFDKLHTNYDDSRPIPYNTREEAQEAARNANRDHNGGGISVQDAFAYPPVGDETEVFAVDFMGPNPRA